MLTLEKAQLLLAEVGEDLRISKFEEHYVEVESNIPSQGWVHFDEWTDPEAFANWARNYDGAE